MRRLSARLLSETPLALFPHARVILVVQKSAAGQCADDVAFQLADAQIAGDADQLGAQIELRCLTIEAAQALDQSGRNDESGVGVAVGVADQQTRAIRIRRRHEIQVRPQAWKWLLHLLSIIHIKQARPSAPQSGRPWMET